MTDNHNGQNPVPEQDDAVQGEVLSDCPLVVAKEQQVPPQEPVQTRRPVAFGVFLACILFGFLLSMQFKSVDISSNALTSQQLRAEELQSLLNKEREKNQELYEELLRGKDDLSQYRDQALQSGDYAAITCYRNSRNFGANWISAGDDAAILAAGLARAELAAGFTDVVGPGLIVTMSDSTKNPADTTADPSYYIIHDNDILQVVNELRDAGAEALSINGERLLATSEIRCAGSIVSVNNNRYAAPYVIRAIGDPAAMSSALSMRGGVIDQLSIWDIQVDVQQSEEVLIRAYTGKTTFQYAQEYKDNSSQEKGE